MVRRPWLRGTRKPLPSRGRAKCSSRTTKVASATSAYSMSPRMRAASGAWGSSSRADSQAGQASITPMASMDPLGVATRHRGPAPGPAADVRRCAGVHRLTASPSSAARASTIRVTPPRTLWNTGGGSAPVRLAPCRAAASCRAAPSGPPRRAASCRGGAQASMLIRSADPALIPPSRGSTSRSNTSSPTRGRSTSPTEASPARGSAFCASPRRSASTPWSETIPVPATASAVHGTPSTERSGRGTRLPSRKT